MQMPSMQLWSSSCALPRWGASSWQHSASSLGASVWRQRNSGVTHRVELMRVETTAASYAWNMVQAAGATPHSHNCFRRAACSI